MNCSNVKKKKKEKRGDCPEHMKMKASCAVCVLALNTLDRVVKHCANPKK